MSFLFFGLSAPNTAAAQARANAAAQAKAAREAAAAQRKADADALKAANKAKAEAVKAAKQTGGGAPAVAAAKQAAQPAIDAAKAKKVADVAAAKTQQTAIKQTGQTQVKAAAQQDKQAKAAVTQRKQDDRKAAAQAKKDLRLNNGKIVKDVTPSDEPRIKALQSQKAALEAQAAQLRAKVAAKRAGKGMKGFGAHARLRRRRGGVAGFLGSIFGMGAEVPATSTFSIDTTIDPALLVPPQPGVKPAGYDKRKSSGKLKPQDMFYELSNTVANQLFPLIQDITNLQVEILGMLNELNTGSTIVDPNMIPDGFGLDASGKLVPLNQPNTDTLIDPTQLPPGSTIGPDGSITYGPPANPYYDPYAGYDPYAPPPPPGYYQEAPPGLVASPGYGYDEGSDDPYASAGGYAYPQPQQYAQYSMQPQGPDFYGPADYSYAEVPDFGGDPVQSMPGLPILTENDMLPPSPPRMDYPPQKAPTPFVAADFGDTFNDNFFTDDDLTSGVLSGMGCDCKSE